MLRRLAQESTSVLPGDTQHLMKASQVDYAEPFLLPQVGSPGLAPTQESADHTGVIDSHLQLALASNCSTL